jgi:hypothetical protein
LKTAQVTSNSNSNSNTNNNKTTMNNKEREAIRRTLGMTRKLQVIRDSSVPHPGGSRGYPLWYRRVCVDFCRALNLYYAQAAAELEPSEATLKSWCDVQLEPFEMRGGPECTELVGCDLLLMCIFLMAWPDAHADDVAIYIINNGGGGYSHQLITRRMKELKKTKKRSSTEAYQAFLPQNILCRQRFFSLPPPVGIAGCPRKKFIDIGECGISLDKTNTTIDHCTHISSNSQTRPLHQEYKMDCDLRYRTRRSDASKYCVW